MAPRLSRTCEPLQTVVRAGLLALALLGLGEAAPAAFPVAVTIEARGRGDAPISAIRLELDGAALPVSFEQRGEVTWRGFAQTRVAAGQHAVHATVIDERGRSGGYRWTFEAGP